MFVHEWAHYRYGIFDEYGQVDDSQYPLFVPAPNTPNSPPLPNVCTDKVPTDFKVVDKNNKPCSYNRITMKYPDGCRYEFASTFKPKSSLASTHALLNSVGLISYYSIRLYFYAYYYSYNYFNLVTYLICINCTYDCITHFR